MCLEKPKSEGSYPDGDGLRPKGDGFLAEQTVESDEDPTEMIAAD